MSTFCNAVSTFSDASASDLHPGELTCDAITADFRIYQRRRGHRYSLDDLATAWEAAATVPDAATVLDMGCGIGSVLLMLAWRLPQARLWGIEALAMSRALALQSIALNDIQGRVDVLEGDLREVTTTWAHGPCDLVTGTPPYLPAGTAIPSPDPQRAAARIELRGGVEDYIVAAERVLAPRGTLVLCADGRKPERVLTAASSVGMHARRRRDIWPRAGAAHPLLSVWTLERQPGELARHALIVRDANGSQTADAKLLRETFGL